MVLDFVERIPMDIAIEEFHESGRTASSSLCAVKLQPIDTMVRPLMQELQNIAIEELNEDPKRIKDDIKHIQEWIKQQPYLNAPTDDQWILGFLRGSKFSLQTTKEKFNMYYTAKNFIPELLQPRDVTSIEIQALLKGGIIIPLPCNENYTGPKIVLFRFHNCTKNLQNVESISALFYMILNILMIEDDNLSVSGILLWVDMVNYPLASFLFQFTPTYMKNFFYCIQHAFPLRVKGIHCTGSHIIGEKLFSLMKGYMGEKLKDRCFVYSEKKFENFCKSVPQECLPKEYGGENSTVEEIKDYWVRKVESYSTWFVESSKYCTNEALRPGKPASFESIIGIDGSFRKLNID